MCNPINDSHTYHKVGQPVPTHVHFTIGADFAAKVLTVVQLMEFDSTGEVVLDSFGQDILSITDVDDAVIDYTVGEMDKILGAPVTFTVKESCRVQIALKTKPDAAGLQWMTPKQAGGPTPLMYSQFQSINARTVFILPDSPSVRFTYTMELAVPSGMRGLVGATDHVGTDFTGTGYTDSWSMKVPVPAYLIALNIGEFEQYKFDEQTSVWAQPHMLSQAKSALARTSEVIAALESLFGRYQWGHYSTVILPPLGFPFGAMEHPCLTSMNGILITDEEEAIRVTTHEATHSWLGNLVTNGTWSDFWLNEGFTVLGEWLAIEKLVGPEERELYMAIAIEELRRTIDDFERKEESGFTKLKTDLEGRDPEDAFSHVPYYKGALFLWSIMDIVGREEMLAFLNAYIQKFRGSGIVTEQMLEFMRDYFGHEVFEGFNVDQWVYEAGFPKQLPTFVSNVADDISKMAYLGELPAADVLAKWNNLRWSLFLHALPKDCPDDLLRQIDAEYSLSTSSVGMMQCEFLDVALQHPALIDTYLPQTEVFLTKYGRTLYIKPLYQALCDAGYHEAAAAIFEKAQAGYHPIGRQQVERILAAV